MKKRNMEYYIVADKTSDQHAGQKARRDIETLADRRGMQAICFRGLNTADGNRVKQLGLIWFAVFNWLKLLFTIHRHAVILFQYPHYPIKSVYLTRWFVPWIRGLKHCAFVGLIHDINSMRGIGGKTAQVSDQTLLPLFDRIICHNEAMMALLIRQGIPTEKLISLDAFDYLAASPGQPAPASITEKSVCVAGNLSREKCGYLYDMIAWKERSFTLHLYGPNLETDALAYPKVMYHGVVPADQLPDVLEGMYGLVWDGDSMDTCSGAYGEYLRYNNPHKVSLYLAANKPVLIWNKAAMAAYIAARQCGTGIASLRQLNDDVDYFNTFLYNQYRQSATSAGQAIRNGRYFLNAWGKVLDE